VNSIALTFLFTDYLHLSQQFMSFEETKPSLNFCYGAAKLFQWGKTAVFKENK